MTSVKRVLVADDDEAIRCLLDYMLRRSGYDPVLAGDGAEALALAARYPEIGLALIDLRMPMMDGMSVLRSLSESRPEVPVIILSAHAQIREALEAIRSGAFDYLNKPFELDELLAVVIAAERHGTALRDNRNLKEAYASASFDPAFFVGSSETARQLRETVERVSLGGGTVLITGESGVGKKLLAQMIHQKGARSKCPLVSLGCSAVAREWLESELFGRERGTFGSLQQRRLGRIELAEGGCLLLSEVSGLALGLQLKLLEFLQQKRYRRVGGSDQYSADVRVIAVNTLELQEKVLVGDFRQDLYDRLGAISIYVPPLRERLEDLPEIVEAILQRLVVGRGGDPLRVDPLAMGALLTYSWPGNVLELETLIERASYFAVDGQIGLAQLPSDIVSPIKATSPLSTGLHSVQVGGMPLDVLEKLGIIQTMELCRGNKSAAAQSLRITERTLGDKLIRYGIVFATPTTESSKSN